MQHLTNLEAGLLQYVQYFKPTDKLWCRTLAEYVPIEVSYPIKAQDWTSSAISMHMPVVESWHASCDASARMLACTSEDAQSKC